MDVDVLIVGAGPAGLMLAGELGLAGVRAVVVEQQPRRPEYCRGFNLNARSLELLDRRSIADRFLAEGPTVPTTVFAANTWLNLSLMDSGHPYLLGIAQTRVEELLEERAARLGVPVRWGHRLTELRQGEEGVVATVETTDGSARITAGHLVGCDGGRSTVRKLAGIDFPGIPASRYALLGDVNLADPADLPFGVTATEHGSVFVIPRPGYVRIITAEPEPPADRDTPVNLEDLQAAVDRALGRHVALREPRWLTRFGDAARQARRYVTGRVILAGDAAHIHPPAGAIGVNVAIDDAMNLGWKLAGVVAGWAPAGLLETYHTERHAAGERLLRNTRAQTLLGESDERLVPVRDLLHELAEQPAVAKCLAELVTGVGTRYPMGPAATGDHPWLGRLAPNLELDGAGGRTRLAELLSAGRAVLIDLADRPELRAVAADWAPRVTGYVAREVGGRAATRAGLTALLVRPDGHVAWLARADERHLSDSLRPALTTWFGPGPPGR